MNTFFSESSYTYKAMRPIFLIVGNVRESVLADHINLPKKIKFWTWIHFDREKCSTSFFFFLTATPFILMTPVDSSYAIFRSHSSRKRHIQWQMKQKFNFLKKQVISQNMTKMLYPLYLNYAYVSQDKTRNTNPLHNCF